MKPLRSLPWLLAALCFTAGCKTTPSTPPAQEVETIPKTGVGTFGGPGAFGGGQKPTTPTAPIPNS